VTIAPSLPDFPPPRPTNPFLLVVDLPPPNTSPLLSGRLFSAASKPSRICISFFSSFLRCLSFLFLPVGTTIIFHLFILLDLFCFFYSRPLRVPLLFLFSRGTVLVPGDELWCPPSSHTPFLLEEFRLLCRLLRFHRVSLLTL